MMWRRLRKREEKNSWLKLKMRLRKPKFRKSSQKKRLRSMLYLLNPSEKQRFQVSSKIGRFQRIDYLNQVLVI